MSTASTVNFQIKNWVIYQFLMSTVSTAASEVKLSVLLKFFFDSFYVFSVVNGVNGKVKKKNWEIINFFDVNGVNGKC